MRDRCSGSGAVAFTYERGRLVATTCPVCGVMLAAALSLDDIWRVPVHR